MGLRVDGGEGSQGNFDVDAGNPARCGYVAAHGMERHFPLQRDASPIAMPASAVMVAMIPAACIHRAR